MGSREIELPVEPVAVPRARAFVVEALPAVPDDVLDDAKLVVTELVTNALLHGEAPRTLRLLDQDGVVRIEVHDASRILPVLPRQNLEAMTGRGLGLVAALSDTWGVEPVTDGKVVWAALRTDGEGRSPDDLLPEIDVDALLASWTDDEPDAEPLYTVRLGAVPTSLLLAAKSHIDNVVREFELVKTDHEREGIDTNGVPSRLIESVTRSFATARTDIKRQAVEAAARGDAETDLVLRLPAGAADAGEAYLEALDEADRYARAARLLTLEAPPVHQLFRRWYVQSLVNQIRAQANGQTVADPPTLLQVLSEEVAELATLRASWERLQLLQKVTAELTGATSLEEIATTVVDNAVEFLGAVSGRVYLLHDDNKLRSIATRGGTGEWVQNYDEIDLDRDLPGPHVVKTGEALFLRNMADIEARYPELAKVYDRDRCLHVTPLTIGEHRLGAFTLTFPGDIRLDEQTQLSFVRALADALAQALERALALAKAALAQERLSFLADASVALSGSIDYEETLAAVGDLLVPRLADWCVIQVLRDDGALETVGLRHFDADREEWALRMRDRYPVQMDAPTGAPNVIRTGESEVYPILPPELVEASAVDDEHLAIIRQVPLRSAVVVPLDGRQGRFGAITLIYAESGRYYDESDVPFVEDVARRAALAMETAESFREQSGRLADVTKVAVAAQRAILAAPPSQVGPIALSARYVSAAAEALVGGDLYEIVARPGMVRLLIGDVRGKGLSAVRTATVVLGEFRASAADLDDLSAVARQIDRRLRPYLGDEDFVTALLAEVHEDGTFAVAACGHPPALVTSGGAVTPIQNTPTLPLGLGSDPVLSTGTLAAGDRLLLYTDGLIEARAASGEFLDLTSLTGQLADGPLDEVLDGVLERLHAAVGPELGDDLALVVAEYTG
jgi:serine phosphatase RsbU (regulator of sigma subunit)/anti-sigma regulatory factor (Ser/Thr protein kinase)